MCCRIYCDIRIGGWLAAVLLHILIQLVLDTLFCHLFICCLKNDAMLTPLLWCRYGLFPLRECVCVWGGGHMHVCVLGYVFSCVCDCLCHCVCYSVYFARLRTIFQESWQLKHIELEHIVSSHLHYCSNDVYKLLSILLIMITIFLWSYVQCL